MDRSTQPSRAFASGLPGRDDEPWREAGWRIDAVAAAALATRGREYGATLDVSMLAAFAVLLFRYRGETDLVFTGVAADAAAGAPAGRVPVRIRLDPAAPFGDAVRRTLAAVRDSGTYPGPPLRWKSEPGAAFDASIPDRWAALDLGYSQTGAGLEGTLRAWGGDVEAGALERLARNLGVLTAALAADRGPVANADLLAPQERNLLLTEWNPAPRPAQADDTLPGRFARQAAARPDATAIVDGELRWTYRELDARANAAATQLLRAGLRSQELVALDAGRGAAAVLGMLAVVRAGGAYLPVDPALSPQRASALLAAANVRLRLGRGPAADPGDGIQSIDLDALDPCPAPAPQAAVMPHPDDLAYVVFTSGSTGRAKGVMIAQGGIVNLVTRSPELAVGPDDVVAQMASIAFDGATYEIWGALLNGATLAIIGHETLLAPAALAAELRAKRVSVAFLTPALLRHVSREEPAAFATLRLLIAGGEVLEPSVAAALFSAGPPGRLLNGYGPTETTTFATTHEVRPPCDGPLPIGRPLANVQTFVLDAARDPVPIGVRGELYIGGAGLARGYLDAPDLTARRFVPHPFSPDPAARLYATGDIVRRRADGTLEFFGRADRQVKVRGFRIELDDVEAVLCAQPGVTGAIVLLERDAGGDARLIAFIADEARPTRGASDWRAALGAQLPDHMLPGRYVTVASIPLNANGKTDFAALAALAARAPATPDGFGSDAPADERDERERAVMRIFTHVLGVAPPGPQADFFSLGGNSLSAARAIARIREWFGVEVRFHDFFAAPTPAALAARIAAAPARASRPVRAAAQPDVGALSDDEIDALLADALLE